jgi:hypothetical protein
MCYCGDYAGYITVILSFLAFYFCSAYFLYLVYYIHYHFISLPLSSHFFLFHIPFHISISIYYTTTTFVLSRLTLHFHIEPPLHSFGDPTLGNPPLCWRRVDLKCGEELVR